MNAPCLCLLKRPACVCGACRVASVPTQALFRPMAMMIPDYALVAEVMLFSEGFEDSRALSQKMVKLYKLASEQLSQQVRLWWLGGRGQQGASMCEQGAVQRCDQLLAFMF